MQIAKIQESLARKALYQPNTRFDDLFSLIANPYWLWIATESVLENSGAKTPGIDGVTGDSIKGKTHSFAQEMATELKTGVYKPQAVKRIYIPKANGNLRPLGIPTIRDRVIQEATRMVLEPILESHFMNCSSGFRPGRRTMDAIHTITHLGSNRVKMWWVVEGDIKGCFDNIPHSKLKGVLGQYVQDKQVLQLLANFLAAGIFEKGKVLTPNKGVPQGGIVSPLLANAFLHELDKTWWDRYGGLSEKQKTLRRKQGLGNVQLVRYADDFVILTNGNKAFAHELRTEFKDVLDNLGLELSEEKTHVTHVNDGLDFLGFHIQRTYSQMANKNIMLVTPSQKNIDKFKMAVHSITDRSTCGDDVPNKIRAVNRIVRGWGNYYRHANVGETFKVLEAFVYWRLYYWLKAKHSNMSAKQSVKQYVVQTYQSQYTETKHTWGLYGTNLVPMTHIKRNYYHIHWPKEGNPYLTYGLGQLKVTDEIPIQDTEHIWKGNSEQSAYAVARLERLELVGHKCEDCGSSEGYLHADHIIQQKDGGRHTVENLRIRCEPCHIKRHSEDKATQTNTERHSQ